MNWKEKLRDVLEMTLNEDLEDWIYTVNVYDNWFEIMCNGNRMLKTECADFHLESNWRMHARSAVLRLAEDTFKRKLMLVQK